MDWIWTDWSLETNRAAHLWFSCDLSILEMPSITFYAMNLRNKSGIFKVWIQSLYWNLNQFSLLEKLEWDIMKWLEQCQRTNVVQEPREFKKTWQNPDSIMTGNIFKAWSVNTMLWIDGIFTCQILLTCWIFWLVCDHGDGGLMWPLSFYKLNGESARYTNAISDKAKRLMSDKKTWFLKLGGGGAKAL